MIVTINIRVVFDLNKVKKTLKDPELPRPKELQPLRQINARFHKVIDWPFNTLPIKSTVTVDKLDVFIERAVFHVTDETIELESAPEHIVVVYNENDKPFLVESSLMKYPSLMRYKHFALSQLKQLIKTGWQFDVVAAKNDLNESRYLLSAILHDSGIIGKAKS